MSRAWPGVGSARRACALGVVGLLLAGCGGSRQAADRVAAGKTVYIEHCSICHQLGGTGYAKVIPRLAGNPIVLLDDPAPTIEFVLKGGGSMPPFGADLDPQQVAEVVSYVRWAWGNHASSVTPKQAR
jgi:mono/diheme cytochrome c family protein